MRSIAETRQLPLAVAENNRRVSLRECKEVVAKILGDYYFDQGAVIFQNSSPYGFIKEGDRAYAVKFPI